MRERELVEQPGQPGRKRPSPAPDLLAALGNRGFGQVLARFESREHAAVATLELPGLATLEVVSLHVAEDKHEVSLTCGAGEVTPQLVQSAASGKRIETARIVRPDGTVVTMTDVYVASVSHGTSGADRPVINLTLNFATIDFRAAAAAP